MAAFDYKLAEEQLNEYEKKQDMIDAKIREIANRKNDAAGQKEKIEKELEDQKKIVA
jgi:hypothetical protein